jgi:hypothetical protein
VWSGIILLERDWYLVLVSFECSNEALGSVNCREFVDHMNLSRCPPWCWSVGWSIGQFVGSLVSQ